MTIPALVNGLLPVGIHVATLAEVRQRFGSDNDRRVELQTKLESFLAFAATFDAFVAFYVDGSFVTDKPVPGDVDGVLFFRPPDGFARLLLHPRRNELLDTKGVKAVYEVHLFLGDDLGLPIFQTFQSLRTEDALQRKVGHDQKKGILKVSL